MVRGVQRDLVLHITLQRCGVPRGSILGNKTRDSVTTRMFADDANMTFTACSISELQRDMNTDLQYLQN